MQANKIAYTYCAPILTGFGIAGSIANLITLYTSPKFSARIYTYLKYLSLYDLGFLSFAFSLTYYIPREGHAEFYRYLIGTPIVNGFLAASVYVVVCMTIDRYKICFYTYKSSKILLNKCNLRQFGFIVVAKKKKYIIASLGTFAIQGIV